jgi:hypothetical protein
LQKEQTVAEMVGEVLARQAVALAEHSGRSLEDALAEVLNTEAGCRLVELVNGPHRDKRAAEWQAGLLEERAKERALEGVPS